MNTKWTRPLTPAEIWMHNEHKRKSIMVCYHLTFESVFAVGSDVVKTALRYLYKKVPTLRLAIGNHNEELWFSEEDDMDLDFEVLCNILPEDEASNMIVYDYSAPCRPLWCCRLIYSGTSKKSFNIIFGFHHSIGDGHSNLRICGAFLRILNDLLNENVIDMQQIGLHSTNSETLRLIAQCKAQLMDRSEQELASLNEKHINVFLRQFPPPDGERRQTRTIPVECNANDTNAFLANCKRNKVTFNSAFCALCNLAMGRLVERDNALGTHVSSDHTINFRRYWKGDTDAALGPFAGTLSIVSAVNKHHFQDLWAYIKEFHNCMQTRLDDLHALKCMALDEINAEAQPEAHKYGAWFHTTNIGRVDSFFEPTTGPIRLERLQRRISCMDSHLFIHEMQTFRNRFFHTLEYNTAKVLPDTAHKYNDIIFKLFQESIAAP